MLHKTRQEKDSQQTLDTTMLLGHEGTVAPLRLLHTMAVQGPVN